MLIRIFSAALLLTLVTSEASRAQQVIHFDSEGSADNSYKGRKKKKQVYKNSGTIGLISAINGYTPCYYERAVTDFLSIQAGAGITYRSFGNDFGQIIWNDGKNSELVDNSTGAVSDIDDQYYHYKFRKAALGSYFAVAPKIYFSDEVMDGFYLAPMVEWKRYNYTAQLANVNRTTDDVDNSYDTWSFEADDRNLPHIREQVKEHMNCLDISLTIGGHYQHKSRLAIGWSIGAGLRKFSATRLDVYTERPLLGKDYFRNNLREYTGMKPVFSANLVVGGCF